MPVLRVSKDRMEELFLQLGYKGVMEWPLSFMKNKLKELAKAKEEERVELKRQDKTLLPLLDSVVEALHDERKIEIVNHTEDEEEEMGDEDEDVGAEEVAEEEEEEEVETDDESSEEEEEAEEEEEPKPRKKGAKKVIKTIPKKRGGVAALVKPKKLKAPVKKLGRAPAGAEKDEYGYTVGTRNSRVLAALAKAKRALTMRDLQEKLDLEDTCYSNIAKLIEDGHVKKMADGSGYALKGVAASNGKVKPKKK